MRNYIETHIQGHIRSHIQNHIEKNIQNQTDMNISSVGGNMISNALKLFQYVKCGFHIDANVAQVGECCENVDFAMFLA